MWDVACSPFRIELTTDQRAELERRARSYTAPFCEVQRAKLVLMAAEGKTNAEIAGQLGTSCQVVHRWRRRFCEQGLRGLADREREVYHEMKALEKSHLARFHWFQDAIAQGKPNNWRCRAGSRYMYICEDGLVHYCSQQRGYPAIPLEKYTIHDLRREYVTEKSCAPHCTVSCVHQVSIFDSWRAPQHPSPAPVAPAAGDLVQIE